MWTSGIPAAYLTWANSLFLALFAFNRTNNLRIFGVAFSPIPTAPTVAQHFAWAQGKTFPQLWKSLSSHSSRLLDVHHRSPITGRSCPFTSSVGEEPTQRPEAKRRCEAC